MSKRKSKSHLIPVLGMATLAITLIIASFIFLNFAFNLTRSTI